MPKLPKRKRVMVFFVCQHPPEKIVGPLVDGSEILHPPVEGKVVSSSHYLQWFSYIPKVVIARSSEPSTAWTSSEGDRRRYDSPRWLERLDDESCLWYLSIRYI